MIVSTCLLGLSLGAFVPTGAGCMSATVVSSDETHVVLQYGPWDTSDEIQRLADSFCRPHGKFARHVGDEGSDDGSFRNARFECVPGSSVEA